MFGAEVDGVVEFSCFGLSRPRRRWGASGSGHSVVRHGQLVRVRGRLTTPEKNPIQDAEVQAFFADPGRCDAATIERMLQAPTDYSEACLGFCDLAPRCHQHAMEIDAPVMLGDDVKRLLGETTITRAVALEEQVLEELGHRRRAPAADRPGRRTP